MVWGSFGKFSNLCFWSGSFRLWEQCDTDIHTQRNVHRGMHWSSPQMFVFTFLMKPDSPCICLEFWQNWWEGAGAGSHTNKSWLCKQTNMGFVLIGTLNITHMRCGNSYLCVLQALNAMCKGQECSCFNCPNFQVHLTQHFQHKLPLQAESSPHGLSLNTKPTLKAFWLHFTVQPFTSHTVLRCTQSRRVFSCSFFLVTLICSVLFRLVITEYKHFQS